MWNACKPIIVGMTSLVSEKFPLFCLPPKQPIFPFRSWTIVYGGQRLELAQKFMQIEIDVKCMHTNLCGHWLFSFRDIATYNFDQISLSDHGSEKLNWIESVQKIHASRDWCQMHAHKFWWVWLPQFWR